MKSGGYKHLVLVGLMIILALAVLPWVLSTSRNGNPPPDHMQTPVPSPPEAPPRPVAPPSGPHQGPPAKTLGEASARPEAAFNNHTGSHSANDTSRSAASKPRRESTRVVNIEHEKRKLMAADNAISAPQFEPGKELEAWTLAFSLRLRLAILLNDQKRPEEAAKYVTEVLNFLDLLDSKYKGLITDHWRAMSYETMATAFTAAGDTACKEVFLKKAKEHMTLYMKKKESIKDERAKNDLDQRMEVGFQNLTSARNSIVMNESGQSDRKSEGNSKAASGDIIASMERDLERTEDKAAFGGSPPGHRELAHKAACETAQRVFRLHDNCPSYYGPCAIECIGSKEKAKELAQSIRQHHCY